MKNVIPEIIQAMIFNHENPEEASSIELPLNSNIAPANVQTKAASKSRIRFETQKLIEFNRLIYLKH